MMIIGERQKHELCVDGLDTQQQVKKYFQCCITLSNTKLSNIIIYFFVCNEQVQLLEGGLLLVAEQNKSEWMMFTALDASTTCYSVLTGLTITAITPRMLE